MASPLSGARLELFFIGTIKNKFSAFGYFSRYFFAFFYAEDFSQYSGEINIILIGSLLALDELNFCFVTHNDLPVESSI